MVSVLDKELVFSRDQIVSSSQASKNFGQVRRDAAERPQFVSGRSGIDTVVVGFEEFEALCLELDDLRNRDYHARIEERLAEPEEPIPFERSLGEAAFERFRAIDADALSDEELFA